MMVPGSAEQAVSRAKDILATVRHGAMATVNEDGSPHNSPVYFVTDATLEHIYWSSSPEALHSKNLARMGQLFMVVYRPHEGGGLYMQAGNAHPLEGQELRRGLESLNAERARHDKAPRAVDFYAAGTQHMYSADIERFWTNRSEKDTTGNVLKDVRYEISRKDLLK